MFRTSRLLLYLVAVPLIAYEVAVAVEMKSGREEWLLSEGAVEEYLHYLQREGPFEKWMEVQRARFGPGEVGFHEDWRWVLDPVYWSDFMFAGEVRLAGIQRRLAAGALAAGALVLLFPVTIRLLRRKRPPRLYTPPSTRLYKMDRPLIWAAYALFVVLGAVHVALIAGSAYLVDTVLAELAASRGWLAVTCAAAAIAVAAAGAEVLRRPLPALTARAVTPIDQPLLWKEVRELADRVGAFSPDHVLLGAEGRVRMASKGIDCLNGRLTGRCLFVPLRFCREASVEEFRGAVWEQLERHQRSGETSEEDAFHERLEATRRALDRLERSGRFRSLLAAPAGWMAARVARELAPAEPDDREGDADGLSWGAGRAIGLIRDPAGVERDLRGLALVIGGGRTRAGLRVLEGGARPGMGWEREREAA